MKTGPKKGDYLIPQETVVEIFYDRYIEVLGCYTGAGVPLLSRCLKCSHEWSPKPQHIFNGSGCPRCAGVNTLTQSEALIRFEKLGFKLLGTYLGTKSLVKTLCLTCQHVWEVKPNSIFTRQGCPECAKKEQGDRTRLLPSVVYERARLLGFKILEPYVNIMTKVLTRCLTCGYEWKVAPNSFRSNEAGRGCPQCAKSGFKPDKPAILYYIKVFNPCGTPLYKIGITNRTVTKRFGREKIKIEILKVELFKSGAQARAGEREILNRFYEMRYFGPDVLMNGNDELFIEDVLGLDVDRIQKELILDPF